MNTAGGKERVGRIERGALKHIFYHMQNRAIWASLVAHPVKNLPTIQETQVPFLGQEDPLEKGMTTHSSILAWETPCSEEPGGL